MLLPMKKKTALALALVMLSALLFAAPGGTIVYVTKTGSKYHTGACASLRKSKIETTLQQAVDSGYEPCARCNPPRLGE
jgi:hypothetical protein